MLMKYVFLIFASLVITACSNQDENYYRHNPQALQDVIKNCTNNPSATLNCDKLTVIANEINELTYQLQLNPQGFGKKILELQQTLAAQQASLQDNPNQVNLRESIEKNKQQLAERLAIVKWLESPES